MTYSNEFKQALPAIKAIPEKLAQTPTLSIGILVQEAHNLYHWAITDEALLIKHGLSPKTLNNLTIATKACAEAQANWFTVRLTDQDATKKWKVTHQVALELRTELFHEFSFAFKDNKQLISLIKSIKKGEGEPNLIQDLATLASVGEDNLKSLNSINFNTNLIAKAHEISDNLSSISAQSKADKKFKDSALLLRNQAFAHLKQLVDEVRENGKFTFRNNKERYQGYLIQYKNPKKKLLN